MGCAYQGSSYETQWEWDPGPTNVIQRLWDPGGPVYTCKSCIIAGLEKLAKPKCYLDQIQWLALSSHHS